MRSELIPEGDTETTQNKRKTDPHYRNMSLLKEYGKLRPRCRTWSWGRLWGSKRIGGYPSSDLFLGNGSLQSFSSVQLVSRVRLFTTPWTVAHQSSLSITNSWSLLRLMSIKSVMPSNHLIPSVIPFSSCLQSLPASVISNESALHIRWRKYLSFSFNISVLPMNT